MMSCRSSKKRMESYAGEGDDAFRGREGPLRVTNPDPVLTSLGTYDALALVNSPAFSGPFRVSFLWSGAGAPGSQNFDVYTLDASGFPDPFETGVTTPRTVTPPPVPEPSTFLLVATGIAAVRKLRRKREPSAP